MRHQFIVTLLFYMEQDEFSQYSDSLRNGRSGIRIPTGERIFYSSIAFSPALRSARPPTQWASECFTGANWPSVAEVKNEWIYSSAPPVCLHDMDRENFTLLLSFFHHQPNIISSLRKA
jgi:hypothetical protein